jgi:beta-glucosidase
VICVGEETYTEKPGDIDDLNLAQGQVEYVHSLSAATSPIVLVIVSGRPRLLNGIADVSAAVIEAYLPGPMGGQAVAEVISGLTAPSGRLPFTYPKSNANIPYPYHHKVNSQCSYGNCEVSATLLCLVISSPGSSSRWSGNSGPV